MAQQRINQILIIPGKKRSGKSASQNSQRSHGRCLTNTVQAARKFWETTTKQTKKQDIALKNLYINNCIYKESSNDQILQQLSISLIKKIKIFIFLYILQKLLIHHFFCNQSIFDRRPENCLRFSKKLPKKIVQQLFSGWSINLYCLNIQTF